MCALIFAFSTIGPHIHPLGPHCGLPNRIAATTIGAGREVGQGRPTRCHIVIGLISTRSSAQP